jgi:hypothetical protein
MSRPIASLSLDLDNKWSYLKTRGDPRWESHPSYLDVVVPRFLEMFQSLELTATVFVVGQDAALDKNHDAIASIAAAGHEIGNHSFHHEPWLHRYSEQQIEGELAATEEHLENVAGRRPLGFRGPGYSFSQTTLRVLARRGYQYDASTFPTFLGPVARAYYFLTAKLNRGQKEERKALFGTLRDGFRPLRPYWWHLDGGRVLEVPVTTMPFFKLPIHVSYLLYLRQFSRRLARCYCRFALGLCRLSGVAPSMLLHPLDFLGCEDESDLAFFPAMGMKRDKKIQLVRETIQMISERYEIVTLQEHAHHASQGLDSIETRNERRDSHAADRPTNLCES